MLGQNDRHPGGEFGIALQVEEVDIRLKIRVILNRQAE